MTAIPRIREKPVDTRIRIPRPNMKKKTLVFCLSLMGVLTLSSNAAMVITEWMYQGTGTGGAGEFIEFTNTGSSAIDMNGWSFWDSVTPVPTTRIDLSGFGMVAPGQSVILTDATAEDFRTAWGLGSGVAVIGSLSQNLGRADAIQLYNAAGSLVDQLVYNDQGTGNVKGPRTQGTSAITTPANYGTDNASAWVLSTGDSLTWTSTLGTGSPGVAAIPEPSSLALLGSMGALAFLRRRR